MICCAVKANNEALFAKGLVMCYSQQHTENSILFAIHCGSGELKSHDAFLFHEAFEELSAS